MIKKVRDGQLMAGMKFEGHESNNYCALNESELILLKSCTFSDIESNSERLYWCLVVTLSMLLIPAQTPESHHLR